jgi:hypothetical protein
MTLGNMRANGVRTLAACCLGCNHRSTLDVSNNLSVKNCRPFDSGGLRG